MNTSIGFGTVSPFSGAGAFDKKFSGFFNSKSSSAKSMFDPLSLGLGAVSAGFNFLSGQNQAATSANIAQAQLAAQNAAILEGREQAKGALGSAMFGPLFAAGAGGDVAFGREKAASMFKTGPLAERERAQELDFRRGLGGLEGSVASVEQQQRENKEALKRSLVEREAAMAGMLGKIAPREVGTYFV